MDFAAANYSLFRSGAYASPAAPTPSLARSLARSSDLSLWLTGLLTPSNTVNNRRDGGSRTLSARNVVAIDDNGGGTGWNALPELAFPVLTYRELIGAADFRTSLSDDRLDDKPLFKP